MSLVRNKFNGLLAKIFDSIASVSLSAALVNRDIPILIPSSLAFSALNFISLAFSILPNNSFSLASNAEATLLTHSITSAAACLAFCSNISAAICKNKKFQNL